MGWVGSYSGFWQLQKGREQVFAAHVKLLQSVAVRVQVSGSAVVSHVLGAQSAVVRQFFASSEHLPVHVPLPHSVEVAQRIVVQPISVGRLQMVSRLAHLAGAVSGMSPQQSVVVLQSLT
jgi:hypothetical protein